MCGFEGANQELQCYDQMVVDMRARERESKNFEVVPPIPTTAGLNTVRTN